MEKGPKEVLREARELKRLTQSEVAEHVNLSLRAYQRFENGEFPKYKSEKIEAIDKFLGTSLYDMIYDIEATVHEPIERYVKSVRRPKIESKPFLVPFLPVKAQAGYVRAYDQTVYLDTLEKYSVPPGVDPRGAEWMYFEIEGDSMEETFSAGDIIFCSLVPQMDWNEIRNFYVYVIITESSVRIKRLFRKDAEHWVMISDNEKDYPQELLKVRDVKQLWVYRKTWHTNARPPKVFEIKI